MANHWELCEATFATLSKAHNWAYHVARTSQRRCRVAKLKGKWRVYRAN